MTSKKVWLITGAADEVVGMVYLDCSLPADVAEIDKRFDPGAEPPEWRGTVEQIDEWATYAQAYAVEGAVPKIPLTYLASYDIPPEPQIAGAVREGQREYTEMFFARTVHRTRRAALHGA